MEKCTHNMAVYLPITDGWCRYCDALSGGCGLSTSGRTIDEARRRFKDKDTDMKIKALRQRYDTGDTLTYQEHRLLQYSEPMCCSRR